MLLHKEITDAIIRAFYAVYNTLGYGFLEKVYENALAHELSKSGLKVQQQASIQVCYDGQVIGDYYADLVIQDKVIVEIKAVEKLSPQHTAQLLNYLKATSIEVGLVLNFGPEPKFERKILTNDRKNHRPN
jgi:GxxExxY protein